MELIAAVEIKLKNQLLLMFANWKFGGRERQGQIEKTIK